MKQIEFIKTKDGILDVEALRDWVGRNVKWLRNGVYTLQIVGKRRARSIPQNKIFWLWMTCIASETGETPDRIHDVYCYMFLPQYVTDFETGQQVRVPGHTKNLSVEAFTVFLNRIQAHAAEMGIILPLPEDLAWEEFVATYKPLLND